MNSILLVDSEAVAATALQTTLSQFGFEVELAASGKAAHTWLRKAHFDLILVEFDLSPHPNGKSVIEPSKSATRCWSGTGLIRELRAARVTTPILVYTTLEGELYETASLDAGADDYIVKKAPVSMLLSRLYAHLRRRARDLGLAANAERRVAIGRFTLDRKTRVLLADQKPVKTGATRNAASRNTFIKSFSCLLFRRNSRCRLGGSYPPFTAGSLRGAAKTATEDGEE